MLYPFPPDCAVSDAAIESAIREQSIDLGLSPPVSVKFIDIDNFTWNNICTYLRYRELPVFESLAGEAKALKVCLASFSSLDASAVFAECNSRFAFKSPQGNTVSFHVHLLEAAPIDLFPLVRVTSHPAFLEFKFSPQPLEFLWTSPHTVTEAGAKPSIRHPKLWGLQPPSAFTIHQRRGPNRLAKPICCVPLRWSCYACDTVNVCSESVRYCAGCGGARSILSPLNVNLTDCPTELVELMKRPCPRIKEFTLLHGSCGLHHHHEDDLYMLPDEAPERDSYSFFTREGLFYTLDIPTSTLILTHVVSVDDAAAFQLADQSSTSPQQGYAGVVNDLIPHENPTQQQRDKLIEEMERSQANASLVASVLAQAQRAVSQAKVELPVKGLPAEVKPTGPVKFAIPKAPPPPTPPSVQEAPRKQFQQMSAESIRNPEVNTGVSILVVDPARKPSVRELRMHQTAALEEIAFVDKKATSEMKTEKRRFVEIFEETKARYSICFVCLRKFQSIEALKVHELNSVLHKTNLSLQLPDPAYPVAAASTSIAREVN
eukprot:Gregarina_sp_Poly_1__8302@NODE_484_length_8016_cov_113_227827_g391_i0_p2_GENE_NODE_484_length_8016_cov_113_227827_g391_i0NODE_484_length_8016_cov_113_227827_g391_i0_p2_ORF_typecomplete_len546_score88_37zfC2H2_6/PF13912_6/90zfC2H2_6/PF13912_6/7_8e03zfC2H2_6/PF13912_6/6_1zfC2H2_2/PF12756_7/1_8e04zfC2H2_2/PF12756_7/0_076Arf/PF00025_21/0_27DUF629/PF04780_12/3e03DUF629/PF04780_12/0_6_NODE_484_length_8016_cov_113_227827_g391_i022173854